MNGIAPSTQLAWSRKNLEAWAAVRVLPLGWYILDENVNLPDPHCSHLENGSSVHYLLHHQDSVNQHRRKC